MEESGLYNLNKGYAKQEKQDLMNDNPIAKDASGGRGGSWMSKHSQSKVGGSPAKMVSPLDKAGARGNHGNHMQIGSDNSQPAGKRTDTPSEYWRKHQQLSHHKKSPANMVSPLNEEGGKDNHSNIMNDEKRGPNPEGGVSDAERWARHQKGAPHHGGKPGGDKKGK